MRPLLLDLFCCEGGAAVGYHRAGFDVIGVDIVKQKRYPFPFVQGDALTPPVDLAAFDAVHASPPCQHYSITKHSHDKTHPDLLGLTLELLAGFDGPWVVENVVGAPMPNPIEVCGAAMRCEADDVDGTPLVLKRHRLFSSNVMLMNLPCACAEYRAKGVRVGGVYGGGTSNRKIENPALGTFRGGYTPTKAVRAELIGCDHMTMHGLSQAIPPAYTEHIGRQLIEMSSNSADAC